MVTGWKRDKRKQCLWYKTKMLQNAFSLLGMLTMEQPCKLSSLMNQQATLTQQCCVISIYTSFKHLLRPSTAYNHPLTKKSATSKNNLGLGLYLKTSLQTKKKKKIYRQRAFILNIRQTMRHFLGILLELSQSTAAFNCTVYNAAATCGRMWRRTEQKGWQALVG